MWSNTRLKECSEATSSSPSSRFGVLGSVRSRNQQLDCKVCKVVSDVPWWLGRAWHNLVTFSAGRRASETETRSLARRLAPLVVVLAALLLLGGAWWRGWGGGGLGLLGELRFHLPSVNVTHWGRILGDSERLLWLEKSISQLKDLLAAGRHREHSQDVSHHALLAEVRRLEAAVERVRRDVQGLLGLDDDHGNVQETVSAQVTAQVRQELRTLLLRPAGDQLAPTAAVGSQLLPHGDSPLFHWLQQRYVSREELKAALDALKLSDRTGHGGWGSASTGGATVTEEQVNLMVKSALRLFSEDRTGMADYALESAGGAVLRTHSSVWSLFCVPPADCSSSSNTFITKPPRVVLQPDNQPGNCWGFAGSQGSLVIRLSMKVVPAFFSLEHIPRSLAPAGSIRSAPRDFTVYGLETEGREDEERGGTLLGSYTYDQDGDALQTFSENQGNRKAFSLIEVHVLSNWGHQDYTCLYRFRVHGTPVL